MTSDYGMLCWRARPHDGSFTPATPVRTRVGTPTYATPRTAVTGGVAAIRSPSLDLERATSRLEDAIRELLAGEAEEVSNG